MKVPELGFFVQIGSLSGGMTVIIPDCGTRRQDQRGKAGNRKRYCYEAASAKTPESQCQRTYRN